MVIGFELQAMEMEMREAPKSQNWDWSQMIPKGTLQERLANKNFTLHATDVTGSLTATYDGTSPLQLWDTETGALLDTLSWDLYSWENLAIFLKMALDLSSISLFKRSILLD